MNNHSISTNKASKQLRLDLGLTYDLGRNVISQFFNLVQETSMGNYWEPKENYNFLIKMNESFEVTKMRIKSKVNKFWFRNLDITEKTEKFDGITILVPDPKKRRFIYMNAVKLKEIKGGVKLPNQVLLHLLVDELGHYDKNHHRGVHC